MEGTNQTQDLAGAPSRPPARPKSAPPKKFRFFRPTSGPRKASRAGSADEEAARSPLLFKQTLCWLQLEVLEGWDKRGDTSAVIDRLTHPHSHALYSEVSKMVYRFHRRILTPDHPLIIAIGADMQNFKCGLRRAELRWAFSEQRMSKEWEEQIVQHIVNFAQSGRNSEKPIKLIVIELLEMVFSAWGCSADVGQAVAEEIAQYFKFEQDTGLLAKTGFSGWVKYMLPFWSCAVLAVCITMYVFVKQLYQEWIENWFLFDELTIYSYANPDYFGRLCKSAFGTLMYDKVNWNETRFLLTFISEMKGPPENTANIYKQAFLRRLRSEENDYNKSPILSVDPLSPIGVELAVHVLCNCNFDTLMRASAVCRTWRYWCAHEHVWREAIKNVDSFLPFLGGAFSLFKGLNYRLPPTARGRALYYAKHLQTRQPVKFQERLLNLVDGEFLGAVKERQEAAQAAAAALEGKRKSRASVFFQSTKVLGGRLVENVQSMLAAEPIIRAIPFDVQDRENNISLHFSSQCFGVIDVEIVERIPPSQGGQPAEDVSLANGQVHLPYLVHDLQLWKDTCPMWGEKGGPQVYLDAFLRWIEKKFWSYWWPRKGSKPVGLSLDDFIAMTWGATEGASEMSLSSPFRDNTQCSLEAELGLDIASPERKERGTLLSQNGLFLAVDQAAPPDRPTTCMLTGGGGAELVWLASRHNRVTSLFAFRSAASGHFLIARSDGGHSLSHNPANKEHLWRREAVGGSKRSSQARDKGDDGSCYSYSDGSYRWRSVTTGRPLMVSVPKQERHQDAGIWQVFFVQPRTHQIPSHVSPAPRE